MKATNEVTLAPPATGCERRQVGRELSTLKNRLLKAALPGVGDRGRLRLFRLAAGEAEALASLTPFPLLVLPELLHEKLEATRRYVARQTSVRKERGLPAAHAEVRGGALVSADGFSNPTQESWLSRPAADSL